MQGHGHNKLPSVGFKNLKKIIKSCRRASTQPTCPDHCPVCDGTFFPSLLNEMSDIVGCFNQRAQQLLELHLASGFRKYFLMLKGKLHKNHTALIEEGKDLVIYALINSIAIRKILKKYDKIHYSKQGQLFKSQIQSMHKEILQSPWLCELIALHINLRETKAKPREASALFYGCYLTFNDGKPSLTWLKAANPKEKCPLCREGRVYEDAVHLEELNILLGRSCREYWEQRLQMERVERVKQVKEHWETQCRAFMGI